MPFDLDDPGLLFRSDVLADPRPLYVELRRRAPIWQLPGQDTFLVSDPVLIRDAVARPDDFSSNMVSMIHRSQDGGAAPFPMLAFRDPNNVLAVADPPTTPATASCSRPTSAPPRSPASNPPCVPSPSNGSDP